MQIFAEAGAYQPPPSGEPNDWIVHLSTSDLSLGTYSIPAGGVDDQTPHTEDEIYVVKTGRATLVTPSGTAPVGPGSVIYVPAGEEHRFTDVTDDLALIVVFAPPYGSRSLPGLCLLGLGDARRLLDAAPRQRVGALVTGIARVPLHPHPVDVVRAHRLGQPRHRSSFLTGFLAAVFQPLRCQSWIHLVIPSSRYLLSVCRLTVVGRCSASSAWMAAISSIRLFVVTGSKPYSSFSLPCQLHHHAPAARPRVPAARAVCVDHDLGHAGRLRLAAARFRHPARGVPPICFGRQEFIQ